MPKPFTPVKSFVFSPPITHTRSVITKEEVNDAGMLLPPGPSINKVIQDTVSKPEKKTKRK